MPIMLNFDLPLDQLKNYRGSSLRPADFDSYWEQALDELHQLEQAGLEPEWQTAAFQLPFAQCHELYFNGVGGARVHARCVFPKSQNNGQNKPFPAVFRFHGYTGSAGDWSPLLPYAAAGFTVFAMDVRGQGGQSTDPGGFAGNTLKGHVTRGLESGPKGLLYRRIFLDTAAIVHLAAGLAEIDENRMGAFGASQGGALALVCAALEPKIRCVWSVYPFLCDHRRIWDMQLETSVGYTELREYLKRRDPRHENIETFFEQISYIDVQYLAPRITAQTVMVVGLTDQICPPSSQFAAYNRLEADKRMILYPDFGHENLPDEADMALSWFFENLGQPG